MIKRLKSNQFVVLKCRSETNAAPDMRMHMSFVWSRLYYVISKPCSNEGLEDPTAIG
jgi:hypothetical protein